MFLRLTFICTLALMAVVPASLASKLEDKSCREHPKLVGSCFSVHGKLSVFNGAPALRIWKVGTKRILGVSEQRFALEGYRNVPDEVQSKINQDRVLLGDYLVCPFTRSRKNEMQLVCIENVSNLVIEEK